MLSNLSTTLKLHTHFRKIHPLFSTKVCWQKAFNILPHICWIEERCHEEPLLVCGLVNIDGLEHFDDTFLEAGNSILIFQCEVFSVPLDQSDKVLSKASQNHSVMDVHSVCVIPCYCFVRHGLGRGMY